jgi:hypothetical protein
LRASAKRLALLGGALLIALTALPAMSANASPLTLSGVGLENGATSLCLDDSFQYGLRAFTCNKASFDSGYQRWTTIPGRPGQLQNQATGRCVDDSSQYNLRAYGCNDPSYYSGYQQFQQYEDRFPYQLRNVATGLCMDDSSQYGLRGFGCNDPSYNNGYQKWIGVGY